MRTDFRTILFILGVICFLAGMALMLYASRCRKETISITSPPLESNRWYRWETEFHKDGSGKMIIQRLTDWENQEQERSYRRSE